MQAERNLKEGPQRKVLTDRQTDGQTTRVISIVKLTRTDIQLQLYNFIVFIHFLSLFVSPGFIVHTQLTLTSGVLLQNINFSCFYVIHDFLFQEENNLSISQSILIGVPSGKLGETDFADF